MKKSFCWILIAVFGLVVIDVVLGYLFTGLANVSGSHPSYTVQDSKSRGAFVEPLIVSPRSSSWQDKQITINEVWLEHRTELVHIYVIVPFVLEYPRYRQVSGYNLCLNLTDGWGTFRSIRAPFFVLEGKGASFTVRGTVVLWEELETAEFSRLNVLVSDNWKFDNAQTLEVKKVSRD